MTKLYSSGSNFHLCLDHGNRLWPLLQTTAFLLHIHQLFMQKWRCLPSWKISSGQSLSVHNNAKLALFLPQWRLLATGLFFLVRLTQFHTMLIPHLKYSRAIPASINSFVTYPCRQVRKRVRSGYLCIERGMFTGICSTLWHCLHICLYSPSLRNRLELGLRGNHFLNYMTQLSRYLFNKDQWRRPSWLCFLIK